MESKQEKENPRVVVPAAEAEKSQQNQKRKCILHIKQHDSQKCQNPIQHVREIIEYLKMYKYYIL